MEYVEPVIAFNTVFANAALDASSESAPLYRLALDTATTKPSCCDGQMRSYPIVDMGPTNSLFVVIVAPFGTGIGPNGW